MLVLHFSELLPVFSIASKLLMAFSVAKCEFPVLGLQQDWQRFPLRPFVLLYGKPYLTRCCHPSRNSLINAGSADFFLRNRSSVKGVCFWQLLWSWLRVVSMLGEFGDCCVQAQ